MSSIHSSQDVEIVETAATRAEKNAVFQSAAPSVPALPRIESDHPSSSGLRVSQRIASDLIALSDLLSVGAAALFVCWLNNLNHLDSAIRVEKLLLVAPAAALIAMLAFRANGLHEMRTLIHVSQQAKRLLMVWLLVAAVAAVMLLVFTDGPPLALVAWLSLAPAVTLFARGAFALLFRDLLRRGPLARRVALIGALPDLARAAQLVTEDRLTQLSAIYQLPEHMTDEIANQHVAEIMDSLANGNFDDVVVLVPSAHKHGLESLIDHLGMLPLRIALLPVVALQTLTHVDAGDTDLISVTIADKPVRGWSIVFKTIFDYLVAAVMLVIFAIPMLAIAVAIKLESRGPVLFKQQRTGLGGRVFRIWKFRSMDVLEDGPSIKQAERGDRRVTRVGRIIRRLSLDELPQIFNVLSGEMSVVGPRPHARAHDAYYARMIPDYRFRFRVKPGISGLAQIHGYRGATKTLEDMAERVSYDVEYAAGYSLWRDASVVALTPFVGMLSANSY